MAAVPECYFTDCTKPPLVAILTNRLTMNQIFQESLWKNFAAVIDTLKNIIVICPDQIWQKEKKIFYMTYHTVIFLDYYLTSPVKDFDPDLPYTISDPDKLALEAIDDVIPNQFYSKEELLTYISIIREKCKTLFRQTPMEKFSDRWINDHEINMHGLCPSFVTKYTFLEILLYNFRHAQHHVAQLNLLLRQKANVAADWISQSD